MKELFAGLLSSPPWKIEAVIEPAGPVAPGTFDSSKNQSMSTPTGILSPWMPQRMCPSSSTASQPSLETLTLSLRRPLTSSTTRMSVASLGPALVRDTAMSFTSESTEIVPPSILMPRSAVVSANAGAANALDATTKPATAAPVRSSARLRRFML